MAGAGSTCPLLVLWGAQGFVGADVRRPGRLARVRRRRARPGPATAATSSPEEAPDATVAFALTFVTPLLQDVWPFGQPPGIFNAASAGMVMGIMIIPTIASLSEDAMSAVPAALRDGAYGLGSSKLQVATRVVFPSALSGIVASVVLGFSRAIGETMIVLVAAGGTPNLTFDPSEPMQTMTAFIAAAGIGDQPTGSTGYKTIFAVGATLFTVTFFLNLLSIRLVRRFREVYE